MRALRHSVAHTTRANFHVSLAYFGTSRGKEMFKVVILLALTYESFLLLCVQFTSYRTFECLFERKPMCNQYRPTSETYSILGQKYCPLIFSLLTIKIKIVWSLVCTVWSSRLNSEFSRQMVVCWHYDIQNCTEVKSNLLKVYVVRISFFTSVSCIKHCDLVVSNRSSLQ